MSEYVVCLAERRRLRIAAAFLDLARERAAVRAIGAPAQPKSGV